MELQPAEQRRRRQREEARRTILEAAEGLLVEEGFETFSMRRLAERCGYTTPTIYHHFNDKKGLLDTLIQERISGFLARMRQVPQGTEPVENWRAMTLAVLRFGLENPTHYRLLTTPRHENEPPPPEAEELIELMQRPLSQLRDEGRLIPDDPEAGRQAAWALVHGLISLTNGRPDYPWSDSLMTAAVDMMVRGLIRPAGAA
jgi:AcrR family transcriptional regulator